MQDWRNDRIRHDRGSGREDHYKNGFRTDSRKRRQMRPHCNVESGLMGNTMEEWWTVLSSVLGARRSRLHTAIMSFCNANALSKEQMSCREAACKCVEGAVQSLWPSATVTICGSTATGLALPSSDLDLVVTGHPGGGSCPDTGPFVQQLYQELSTRPAMFQELTEIPHARVPILKGILYSSGIACDISFAGHGNRSIEGILLVQAYMDKHVFLGPLCMVLKKMLRNGNLNEVFTGGIGSFCLTILVVHHLQKLGSHGAANDVGALLLSFLARYAWCHSYATDVVSVTSGRYLSKQPVNSRNLYYPDRLSVESPFDPHTDIGYSSFKVGQVRARFARACTVLWDHWNDPMVLEQMFASW